jgi:hypothetical protein
LLNRLRRINGDYNYAQKGATWMINVWGYNREQLASQYFSNGFLFKFFKFFHCKEAFSGRRDDK